MTDTLYLDLGNTRAKWWLSSELDIRGYLDYSCVDDGINLIKQQGCPIGKIVLASVLKPDKTRKVVRRLQKNFNAVIKRCVVTREAQGVTCAYDDLSKLGIDRWLVVVAVWQRYKTACQVVDLGTAITIDQLDKNGSHLGGFIVGGLGLSIKGLLAGTDNIRTDSSLLERSTLLPGQNTTDAVYHGAMLSAVSLIETSYENATRHDSDTKLILAGGDAGLVGPHLRYEYEILEGLVYEGMRILDNTNMLIDAADA